MSDKIAAASSLPAAEAQDAAFPFPDRRRKVSALIADMARAVLRNRSALPSIKVTACLGAVSIELQAVKDSPCLLHLDCFVQGSEGRDAEDFAELAALFDTLSWLLAQERDAAKQEATPNPAPVPVR